MGVKMQDSGRQEFTISEVARLLDYHPDAVRYWVRVGELPGTQDSQRGDWVVAGDDLVSFLRVNGEAIPEKISSHR
jgi:transposase-like protein